MRGRTDLGTLRIGFIARSLGRFRGGVDLYVDQLLRHLAPVARDAGHQVLALFDDPLVAERFAAVPAELSVVRAKRTGKLLWDHLVTPAWCRSKRIDVVLCPRSFRPVALPCRSVAVIYDLMYFDIRDQVAWWDHTYFRNLHRLALHRCDAVITFSEFTAVRLRTHLPALEAARIHMLPPGPPHPVFQAAAPNEATDASMASPVPTPFVLVVGGRPRKNVPRMMEAFARIRSDVEHSLVIASVWERPRRELEALARELGLAERVVFLGRVALDELVCLYRRADAFMYVSLYEGIGIPPLEAMACGCPVVASNAASLPEVTAGAALLVNPLDVDSIASGIRRVLLDRELREQLRRKGRRRVAGLSWDDVARRTLSVLASPIQGVRSGAVAARSPAAPPWAGV